jgi:hypothetical protein
LALLHAVSPLLATRSDRDIQLSLPGFHVENVRIFSCVVDPIQMGKNCKKIGKVFLKCRMFSLMAESFYGLDFLHGGIGDNKLQFLKKKKLGFFSLSGCGYGFFRS